MRGQPTQLLRVKNSYELAEILKIRRVDIASYQETRWKGAKSRNIGQGYSLIYHGLTNAKGFYCNADLLRSKVSPTV